MALSVTSARAAAAVKADQNLDFARVQQAIELARSAGVRVVGAITEQRQSLVKKKKEGG